MKYCQLCMSVNKTTETIYAITRDDGWIEPKTSPRTSVSSMMGASKMVTASMTY